jgi:HK97 family phage major capsid protein
MDKELQEGIEKLANETKEAVNKTITEKTAILATKEEIKDLVSKEEYAKVEEAARKQGEEITALKAQLESAKPVDNSVRGQVTKWMEKNKEAIEKIKKGQKADLEALTINKVAITMTEAASLNSSAFLPNAQVLPGFNDLIRQQPTFWDYIPKARTSANPLVWVNKTNKQGNATFIGEGVLKPLASFELETETSTAKKVAERMKVSTEMLHDVDGLVSMIEGELRYEVLIAASTAVLTGTASATVPAGITTLASAFTLTTVTTTDPNNADAIRAAIAQLASLYFTSNIVAIINPIDAANMDLTKADTSGVYMLPPFVTADGRYIAGVPVIESTEIAVGFLLIGDLSKYKISILQDFHIMWGWENDDFSKNLVTVIGEMRFHQYMSANHTGAFIYESFADIKTAITAV